MRVYTKWLVFKSIRGLDRPWLVFSPEQRVYLTEEPWANGFKTWNEAIASIRGGK